MLIRLLEWAQVNRTLKKVYKRPKPLKLTINALANHHIAIFLYKHCWSLEEFPVFAEHSFKDRTIWQLELKVIFHYLNNADY